METQKFNIRIKKADDELQVVYGEVYPADRPDVEGDFMPRLELLMMAHRFLLSEKLDRIDTNHDNIKNGSFVVESWIQQEPSEIFLENAWIVGVHVPDPSVWGSVKNGDLNGFSMEALVNTTKKVIEIELEQVITTETYDDDTGHVHTLTVRFSDEGIFLGGRTDVVNDHFHLITRATHTDLAANHEHRYSLIEFIGEVDNDAESES